MSSTILHARILIRNSVIQNNDSDERIRADIQIFSLMIYDRSTHGLLGWNGHAEAVGTSMNHVITKTSKIIRRGEHHSLDQRCRWTPQRGTCWAPVTSTSASSPRGEAVQVDPMNPTPVLKAPGSKKCLKLRAKCDEPLSDFAFKCNLRRY
jgi:hypothetical protein